MEPMSAEMASWLVPLLRCPTCGGSLHFDDTHATCTEAGCCVAYPIVDGVPILIVDERSVFRKGDYIQSAPSFFRERSGSHRIRRLARERLSLSANHAASAAISGALHSVRGERPNPRTLLVGGGIPGAGFEALLAAQPLRMVETDVSVAPRTQLVCDCHDLPFRDGSFDLVIAQAVLEHVLDPVRCVEEIHRVLDVRGLVYVEVPFIQQVHGGRFDFTRYTQLGLRRLLRDFEEMQSGPCCGPGMALAWSYRYFLTSLFESPRSRLAASAFAHATAFWLPILDRWLLRRRGALDSASAFYLLGRKSGSRRSDAEILASYGGLN